MAEGYADDTRLIRWGEQHDFEELAVPPGRQDGHEGENDEDEDGDGDDEPEGDDD